ncbi:MAG: hypothetical protein A3I44_06430 [Candidatus Sungbacteria bacterium RIFCSPLOWO2_02_FULL_51_17]|uniref:CMP/dCMP-type deaminase domain-containing protein n=1 Tax=Candidatus Sungbacteria bacterium RIFCSPHIGHO2_02_FULL_51_29 TaxID=1802273 RepID=A0A1G2KVB1_9BACT|nr:MAG: hypothetical protein A2676_04900 [Candidatus Sungbacteria bacterium RIFCSPHIGHO2_01_FULL_51_22]OHA02391.1 MAG: hypothetical protein A3C16_02245 [Candidatus Sungbacteria bacterium RIFCSPHIGHO2_02_FULL_51_29]OHA11126.1 MAG: hypothetical protein A3I44_06430 [Candidatus Sungbacteria bacterium RIFCSPLOWO2_02_FULL_51_17]
MPRALSPHYTHQGIVVATPVATIPIAPTIKTFMPNTPNIAYPYVPEGKKFLYVGETHPYIIMAKAFARFQSLDAVMPGAAVVVKDDVVLGIGANGSGYHKKQPCQRVVLGCTSGEGYDLCEGCHPKNHSEAKALATATANKHDTNGADLYLWGHWWCCRSCWDVMLAAGIRDVYLLEHSEMLFNKEHPDNIVGKQFTS